ncbi:sensor histidine kinase [Miniphocaeibacter massiliensis]|uniref:sensor histidine kinase n=1 Tax=Miniphocaeibacter massiliensis TaxID=2041841 RepID=UPI00101AEA5F|nr:HAMP domain-containing sensor histidine kinase [Miniphocaeibacter massiliensis]
MLVKLKRKFITITMTLVSFVLLAILISIYVVNYKSMDKSTTESMANTAITILDKNYVPENTFVNKNTYYTFIYKVVNDKFVYINSNIDQELKSEVAETIFKAIDSSDKVSGFVKEHGMKYLKLVDPYDNNERYVAISFVAGQLELLKSLLEMLITAFIIAFVFIFLIAKFLANWALEPVEKAWYLQKQFIADASHELKTPLTIILANLKILKKYNNLTSAQNKWIDNTNDEAIRMKDLVEEMLYLAKGDMGNMNINYSDVNFSELVEEVLLTFESIVFEKGLKMEYASVDEEIHCIGDRGQLKRLIIILIDNACKYSEQGNNIDINLYKKDKKIFFKITSIGNIISEKNSKRIFERFIRDSESRNRDGEGGYGLGLAIANKIVENHKGKIRWEPYRDIGNTFIVELGA